MTTYILVFLLGVAITQFVVNSLWRYVLERKHLARSYLNTKAKLRWRLLYKSEIIDSQGNSYYDYCLGDRQHEIEGNQWLSNAK